VSIYFQLSRRNHFETGMARIAIVVDGELAHVSPTFSIAKELTKRGHQICYIGLAPAREPVAKKGFSFIPVGQSVIGNESTTADTAPALSLLFQSILRGDFLDPVVEAMEPQLIITLSVFCLIALTLTYRYQIPVVLLRTQCTLLSRREELRNSIASGLLQVSGKIAELCHLLQKPWTPAAKSSIALWGPARTFNACLVFDFSAWSWMPWRNNQGSN
jgi:UDP:flavonoid glycosyltransferase YjiC (YdhE family)